jgi:hypothetical protein
LSAVGSGLGLGYLSSRFFCLVSLSICSISAMLIKLIISCDKFNLSAEDNDSLRSSASVLTAFTASLVRVRVRVRVGCKG